MTGALCVIGENSTKPLIAVLFQLAFLLIVLKTAPYEDDDDDLSSFISSLAIVLTCLCGFALSASRDEFSGNAIGNLLIVVGVGAVIGQIFIMVRGECRHQKELKRFKEEKNNSKTKTTANTETNQKGASSTRVHPAGPEYSASAKMEDLRQARLIHGAGRCVCYVFVFFSYFVNVCFSNCSARFPKHARTVQIIKLSHASMALHK
jgi:hypothetical protein